MTLSFTPKSVHLPPCFSISFSNRKAMTLFKFGIAVMTGFLNTRIFFVHINSITQFRIWDTSLSRFRKTRFCYLKNSEYCSMFSSYPAHWQLLTTCTGAASTKSYIRKTDKAATKASHFQSDEEREFYPQLLNHICNMMLARNSADPTMSHSGLGFKNCANARAVTNTHHRHLHKNRVLYKGNWDTNM